MAIRYNSVHFKESVSPSRYLEIRKRGISREQSDKDHTMLLREISGLFWVVDSTILDPNGLIENSSEKKVGYGNADTSE